MLLTPEVLAILVLNLLFGLFGMVAFVLSLRIFLKWDADATTPLQYTLEKQSFLAATIIKYIFSVKVPLFAFFIFTLDKISGVITGAMCAAGVVDATQSGMYLIALKIINLYLFASWLKLHSIDMSDKNQPYTKLKFGLFLAFFLSLLLELVLDFRMFQDIEIDKMVSCCGSIYSSSSTSALSTLFKIDNSLLLLAFYGNYFLILLFFFFKKKYLFSVLNTLFIPVSLISLILFFGTYIYELPSHHCPFCFLQGDYRYVGYFLYISLFLGTFHGMIIGFMPKVENGYKISLLFNSLYVILLTLYVLFYYFKNGVFL